MSGSPAGLSIATQYRIPDGTIPDMVIFNGGGPVCVVEVKIDAAFQAGQLEGYGAWLRGQAGGGQPERMMIEDGFYAFVSIESTAHEWAHDCRRIPGFDENGWFDRDGGGPVEGADPLNIDSTGWYRYFSAEASIGCYARICPLQDLLDEDGRIGNRLRNWTEGALARTVDLWTALFP